MRYWLSLWYCFALPDGAFREHS